MHKRKAIAASAVITDPLNPTCGRQPFCIKWSPCILYVGDGLYTKLQQSFGSIAQATEFAESELRRINAA
jgi:hypothetical protein